MATTPVDMRKSFDGLAEVVRSFLGRDPLSGSLFVFRNRGGHLLKILWWDRDGLAIYYKRLERGAFHFPRTNETAVEISRDQFLRLLSGHDVVGRRSRPENFFQKSRPLAIAPSQTCITTGRMTIAVDELPTILPHSSGCSIEELQRTRVADRTHPRRSGDRDRTAEGRAAAAIDEAGEGGGRWPCCVATTARGASVRPAATAPLRPGDRPTPAR